MAEFKFPCPECEQHILCDTSYAGEQINCPTCQKLIVVPPAPPALATRQSTATPAAGRQFAGAPGRQPPPPARSHAGRNILIVTAVLVVLAGFGAGGWHFYSKHRAKAIAARGNPAAQVTAPSAMATIEALSVLSKVHSAYTNLTSVRADGTVTMFIDLSKITVADINPNEPAGAKNATRHPPGMPRVVTNTTELSIKRAQPDLYYVAGESVSKIDPMTLSNTFAFWASDKGKFMFNDMHQRGIPASYRQLADSKTTNSEPEQFKRMQQIFEDPAQLAKIIKDLGQTEDESVNGQDCCTLTAKVLGQKVKVWVDKTSYLILQWQITLGGSISDADIDDVFALYRAIDTNTPQMQLDMVKTQVKKMTPVMTKIRGTITSISRNMEINPALSADDFSYPVPQGIRLIRMTGAATTTPRAVSSEVSQRNACINNLRQLAAAKNQWALENGKTNGGLVTEANLKPYIKLDAGGNLPKCPAGGKYTIGRVGESPTCSISGHVLP